MNIREALQQQAPSLALQRSAANEIARLDSYIAHPIAQERVQTCFKDMRDSLDTLYVARLGKSADERVVLLEAWVQNLPHLLTKNLA